MQPLYFDFQFAFGISRFVIFTFHIRVSNATIKELEMICDRFDYSD